MSKDDFIIWKAIPGYVGFYEASNTGLIRRIKPRPYKQFTEPIILAGWINADGYRRVTLHMHNKRSVVFAHRLVLAAFAGEPPDNHEVNHKDGNRLNNAIENLEYIKHGDNVRYAYQVLKVKRNGGKGERNSQAKITETQARQIKRLLLEKRYTVVRIAETMGVSRSIVQKIKIGDCWSHITAD